MTTVDADAARPEPGPPEAAGPGRVPTTDPWARAAGLVRAAQCDDALALNDLLDLLTPYVSRLCRPIALSHTADAVQESLIAVFQGLPRLKEPESLYAWVRTITVREAMRVAKRTSRETPVSDFRDLPGTWSTELEADVRDVLRRLPPEHRAVLVLRELEGLDERSASILLNISQGTVKSRLHRARKNFRKAWKR
ncbi:sigma-70 family RNA polymerase sigma factor [Streptomyces blastmyceticus]|uniref:RNA polymerase subunit sigma-24 n=1 Tax=Streptomyces blastmyceticus TaxID=68180 RepID=A0ABP3HFT3_9ACTN